MAAAFFAVTFTRRDRSIAPLISGDAGELPRVRGIVDPTGRVPALTTFFKIYDQAEEVEVKYL